MGQALCALLMAVTSMAGGPTAGLDVRAELLALQDGRRFDEGALARCARHPDAAVRAATATALGLLANPSGGALLETLGKDASPVVRAAAAEAAGRLAVELGEGGKGTSKLGRLLHRLLVDPEPAVRRAAAWGVAARGGEEAADRLLARLRVEASAEVRAACLAELWRFPKAGWLEVAAASLDSTDPGARAAAAWSLARCGLVEAVPALKRAAASPDPLLRALAFDGARRAKAIELWEAGGVALGDPDFRVRIAALGALAALREADPKLELSAGAAERVVGLIVEPDPPRVHERIMAIRVAGVTEIAEPQLRAALSGGERWVAAEALAALARQRADGVHAVIGEWLASSDEANREAAVMALSAFPNALEQLTVASVDPSPRVRLAVVDSLSSLTEPQVTSQLLGMIADQDPAVRAAALEALRKRKAPLPASLLRDLLRKEERATQPDAAVALIDALAAPEKLDAESEKVLGRLSHAADPVTARTAWTALQRHAKRRPLPLVVTGQEPSFYRKVVEWAGQERWLEVVTVRGTMLLRLDTGHAPLTCFRLVELADKHFFDGLTFHRVVPNFVIQGGDPRGDGWGGPGFVLRDELDLEPYDEGAVGMALSGPDTGGSQFFVTITPQPHLVGRYPRIGKVVAGLDVAGRIRRGDRILRVRAGEGPLPAFYPVWYGLLDPARLDAQIAGWREEREAYRPRPDLVDLLATARMRYGVVAAMGTWCGDSREQIPRLQAVLKALGERSPFAEPVLIGGDRGKGYPPDLWRFGAVELVPTVVITLEGQEVGRIVETPASGSVDEDLVRILAPVEGWQVPEPSPAEEAAP